MPLSTPLPNGPPYLKGALIAESNLFPRLINPDYESESEDDHDSARGARNSGKRNKNEEDRVRVAAQVKRTPLNDIPRLDIPTAVATVISLIQSGERVDFEPPVTKAFNEARSLVISNGGKDDATVLNGAQREVFGRWKQIMRPSWLKHASLKRGTYEEPEANEPVWVQACWVWLHGMRDNEGIVEDSRGRISIAHLEGRSIFWMTTPKESYRPTGVSASIWNRSFDMCHLLFACPGLYDAILTAHDIQVGRIRHLNPSPLDFPRTVDCNVVDMARWYAGKGMHVETANKVCHYAQEWIRARWTKGAPIEDAVRVSKWLIHRRHDELPSADETNWFEPEWAGVVRRDQGRQACSVRARRDLLEEEFSEREAESVLADFDAREYIDPAGLKCEGRSTIDFAGRETMALYSTKSAE
jgi:hypothetical protein